MRWRRPPDKPAADSDTQSRRGRSALTNVSTFVIHRTVVEETIEVLREAGQQGLEAFVLWGARMDREQTLEFRSAIVPKQTAHRTASGLLVTVEGEALFSANKTLYERGEILAAQVHSHPTNAFHSDTDDCYSLVTLVGALSIVLPDFGRDGLAAADRWAWYRLVGPGRWSNLTADDRIVLSDGDA